jgi:site-specific DNA-methyltransferase (adenine-specific)
VVGISKNTKTSKFGISKRENHNSSSFYKRRLYDATGAGVARKGRNKTSTENPIPTQYLDNIVCKSSENMNELPDSSVHLAITSPPYNVGKTYDQDLTLEEYRQMLKTVFEEVFRVLVIGGRVCINVANLGRKPYIPLHSHIVADMLEIGFLMRGEIIWNKGSSAGSSTAWGSWKSAANPSLRDVHEYILVFSKGSFSRSANGKQDTISKEEFLSYTKSVWEFPTESATRVEHPAPFPIELPYRCIQLYTFEGDIILDPFCGVGSSCIAAVKSRRHFVGYDNNQLFVDVAVKRIEQFIQKRNMQP